MEPYECQGIHVISRTHAAYPALLNQIYDPPILLYVRGNLDVLQGKTIGFVGNRRMSDYGKRTTEKLVAEIAPVHPIIVSGLAQGVDAQAHRSALNHQLPTVAVFGCGIDVIYPPNHRHLADEIVASGGALVSEYPLGLQPTKFTFPQRNRIVAGMSYGVLIIEGNLKSGSLITARCALDENRAVFAVPGNLFSPGSEGPHYLIQNGAVPVTKGDDILSELQWAKTVQGKLPAGEMLSNPSSQVSIPLSEAEEKLLSLIPYEPMLLELIQNRSGLSAAKMGELLTLLELNEQIAFLPGTQICRL